MAMEVMESVNLIWGMIVLPLKLYRQMQNFNKLT